MHLLLLAVLSSAVKAANYVLHHMFDTSECHTQQLATPPLSPPDGALPPPPPPHMGSSFANGRASGLAMARHAYRREQVLGRSAAFVTVYSGLYFIITSEISFT